MIFIPDGYVKFWGTNKVHYGKCGSGVFRAIFKCFNHSKGRIRSACVRQLCCHHKVSPKDFVVFIVRFTIQVTIRYSQKVGTTFSKTTSFLSAHFLYDKMLRPECQRSRVSFHSSNNNYCYIILKCTISLTKRRYRIKYESV